MFVVKPRLEDRHAHPVNANPARWLIFLLLTTVAFTLPVAAQVNGAIYTTTSDGTTVNGNIYDSKDAVYLSGGPQNKQDPGLQPDGTYYFQVTDPSGAVLLSTDNIACRQVVVTGGRMAGVPSGSPPAECTTGYHAIGTFNSKNGTLPVQLMPYNDTPNPGGEYKAWVTPVTYYDAIACAGNYGFCDSYSKTDNYKVKSANAAYLTVCKFNDIDGDTVMDGDEILIPHWPIVATGVDGDSGSGVNTQTDDNGCVSFTYSGSSTQTVTLAEGSVGPDWSRTAPLDASGDPFTVSNGVISVTLKPGDNLTAPYFGNYNPYCTENCTATGLVVTKTAYPSFTRTFKWDIKKSVDVTAVKTADGSARFNYTVEVTHDNGTDSDWQVTGNIRVSNPTPAAISAIDVSDTMGSGANCIITGGGSNNDGTNMSIPAGSHIDVPYKCTFSSNPGALTNTATANWDTTSATGTASVDFANATIKAVDGTVTVSDSLYGDLGTVTYTDPSPKTFTYSKTFTDPAGTCTSHENTVTFTSTDAGSKTNGSANQTVKVCVGADPTASKTATPAYDPTISKSVDKTKVEQSGGSITFNYTVKVTESNWKVTGNISVVNPNDWEALTVNLADALDISGGVCTITGGNSQTVAASSSISAPYSCTFSAAPPATSGNNNAIITWDNAAFYTPHNSATGTAGFKFGSLTVTDTFNGTTTTLGTIPGNAASTTYTYAHTVQNATGGTCSAYTNTAVIKETGQSSNQTVTVCNTATGGLTMGFWQNKNGQGIISGGGSVGGVCNSGTWLRSMAPFQDLAAGAKCSAVASYVYNIVKVASASGASMNAMLKAQMLATALDVYFSDPTLGGTMIGAATAIGGVKIDLTQPQDRSAAFGGAPSMTVTNMLIYAASQSNLGGSLWYGNVKSVQEPAKNAFDAINNQVAYIAP
jgi:hypothetical protein